MTRRLGKVVNDCDMEQLEAWLAADDLTPEEKVAYSLEFYREIGRRLGDVDTECEIEQFYAMRADGATKEKLTEQYFKIAQIFEPNRLDGDMGYWDNCRYGWLYFKRRGNYYVIHRVSETEHV